MFASSVHLVLIVSFPGLNSQHEKTALLLFKAGVKLL